MAKPRLVPIPVVYKIRQISTGLYWTGHRWASTGNVYYKKKWAMNALRDHIPAYPYSRQENWNEDSKTNDVEVVAFEMIETGQQSCREFYTENYGDR